MTNQNNIKYQKSNIKNTNQKLKSEFKKRLYNFTLGLIEFIDRLLNDNVSKRIGETSCLSTDPCGFVWTGEESNKRGILPRYRARYSICC
jgi:hypothetical protein